MISFYTSQKQQKSRSFLLFWGIIARTSSMEWVNKFCYMKCFEYLNTMSIWSTGSIHAVLYHHTQLGVLYISISVSNFMHSILVPYFQEKFESQYVTFGFFLFISSTSIHIVFPAISAPATWLILKFQGVLLEKQHAYFKVTAIVHRKCQNYVISTFQIRVNNCHYDIKPYSSELLVILMFHCFYTCFSCNSLTNYVHVSWKAFKLLGLSFEAFWIS